MRSIRAIWAAWVRLLDRREPGDSMALLRIAVGVVVLITLADIVRLGLVNVIWLDRAEGGYRMFERVPHLMRWLGGPSPAVVWGIVVTAIAGSVLLIAGLGGRITPFVVLQCLIALHRRNDDVSGSADIVITNTLWLLVLARSTATLSADCWLRTRRFRSDEEISAFPRYLAILQIVLIYTSTGLAKLSFRWLPMSGFSAIYYILQHPAWHRFSMEWAARVYPLMQLGTAVTWVFEVTAPALLLVYYFRYTADRGGRLRRWVNRIDLRVPWAATGFALHALIFATMVVGPFSESMLSLYVCLWHPDELRAAGRWLRDRVTRARSGALPAP